MTPEQVIGISQQALQVMLMLSAPVLAVALGVGLLVSIFQAATQINEMTLTFIPKLVAMLVTLLIAAPWMLTMMTDYMRQLFDSIPALVN
jgi:flagellar biosynthetic protein FliQ